MLTQEKTLELEMKANDIRESIINMLVEAGSGHTAGPLGMADIFAYFYFLHRAVNAPIVILAILRHCPKKNRTSSFQLDGLRSPI
jgi:hypothetical protein